MDNIDAESNINIDNPVGTENTLNDDAPAIILDIKNTQAANSPLSPPDLIKTNVNTQESVTHEPEVESFVNPNDELIAVKESSENHLETVLSIKNNINDLKNDYIKFTAILYQSLESIKISYSSMNHAFKEIQMTEFYQLINTINDELIQNSKQIYHQKMVYNKASSLSSKLNENLELNKTQTVNFLTQIKKLKIALKAARAENNDLSKQVYSLKSNDEASIRRYSSLISERDSISENLDNILEENHMLKETLKNSSEIHDQVVEKHKLDIDFIKRDLQLSNEKYDTIYKEYMEYTNNKIKPKPLINYYNSHEIEAERQRYILQIKDISQKYEDAEKRNQDLEIENNNLKLSNQNQEKIFHETKINYSNMEQNFKDKYFLLERTLNDKINNYLTQIKDLTAVCEDLKLQINETLVSSKSSDINECYQPEKTSHPKTDSLLIEDNSNKSNETAQVALNQSKVKILENILETYSKQDIDKVLTTVSHEPNHNENSMFLEFLNDYEDENNLLKEQIGVLKEEIRRIERNSKRQETLSDADYFKDIFINFLLSTPDEKEVKLPVIANLLQPNKEELNKLNLFATLPLNEASKSTIPQIVNNAYNYIGKWI